MAVETVTDEAYYCELVRPLVAGRKIILTGMPLGAAGPTVELLRWLDAGPVFVLAESRGTGPVPDGIDWYDLGIEAGTAMDALRTSLQKLRHLPSGAAAALDAFDPDRSALVLPSMFNDVPAVAGRSCLAHRPPAWIALEDKVVIDRYWDRWGIDRPPSAVVAATRQALRAAATRFDTGAGTVWAGDAREGWHGGAELTRWVRDDDEARDASEYFAAHCDRVRVTPFLEGIPCSIHGIVLAGAVIALRPLEMVTLRDQGGGGFFYAGAASFWDPSDDDREAMRGVARRAGEGLRAAVGYRGGFTVDGVMTRTGFLPTELNARAGAGLTLVARALPELPLTLLLPAITSGMDLDYRPAALEALIVEGADRRRAGGTWRAVDGTPSMREHEPVVHAAGKWRFARPGERADGHVDTGPGPAGLFVRLLLDGACWPAGAPVGPAAAAFWAFADRALGTSVGPLTAAPDVRSRPAR